MNRIPRTRFVTLMAAAAGVTAGLSSMANPAQALARTPTITTIAADTLPGKAAAAPKKSDVAAKPAKSDKAAPATAEKKPDAATKAVVATGDPNVIPENDVCATEQDCRNLNGAGW
jgi:hypothetical protein